MKAFHKVAAALATVPVAGVIALSGAGVASAAPCPVGQHWNEMGGGSGFCSPDASGGGTGGSITTDLGGTNAPAPQAPAMPAPPAYKPPVYAPAPVQQPAKVVPAQQAPVRIPAAPVQAPAPAQKAPVPAQVTRERNIPAPAAVKGSEVSEVASAHGKEVSEPNKAEAEAHKDAAVENSADKKTESKEVDPAVVAPTATASSTTSATPTEVPVMEIDASRSSEVRESAVLSGFILLLATLAGIAAFLAIRTSVLRKNALIKTDENS